MRQSESRRVAAGLGRVALAAGYVGRRPSRSARLGRPTAGSAFASLAFESEAKQDSTAENEPYRSLGAVELPALQVAKNARTVEPGANLTRANQLSSRRANKMLGARPEARNSDATSSWTRTTASRRRRRRRRRRR